LIVAPATVRGGRLIDRLFVRSTVIEIEQVAARMKRVRLAGPGVAKASWIPGQQVRVLVNDLFSLATVRGAFRDALRTYSVWDRDPGGATLDLCVLDHGDGPGARWTQRVAVGDEVAFSGPEGKFALRDGAYHVFIGEETAQVAFGAMLRATGQDAPVYGALEVYEADRLSLPRGSELSWSDRGGGPAENSPTLLAAVRALQLPDTPGVAYLAGEAKTCAAIRRHFIDERGWSAKTSLAVKPFWTPGKRGLE
jgi:NADPH-dependent ferric siderophore reductase